MTMLALTLMGVLHGPLLFAEVGSQSQSIMSWPMQAGESVNDLARLFYPQDKYMQQQFVAATIKLNLESQLNLDPATAFDQESTIVIPSIKALSKKGKHKFTQPVSGNGNEVSATAKPVISMKLQADYANLVKRNAVFKEEVDTLNAKLANLQQVFVLLKTELMQFIESATPIVSTESVATVDEQKSVNQSQKMMPVIIPAHAEKSRLNNLKNNGMHPAVINASTTSASGEQTPYIKLLVPVAAILLAIGLFVGINLHTRRQTAKIRFVATHTIKPLEKSAFFEKRFDLHSPAVLPSVKSTESFLSSVSPLDIAGMEVQELKEEGEQIMEQAKIYVGLGKEDDAIRLLNAHINAAPKAALRHWLYLLDIYRNTNQKEAFLQSARQLHQTFNVVIPRWEKSSSSEIVAPVFEATSLEEYDYIVDKVTKLWADCSKEAKKIALTKNYLDELLTDNRNGERAGFSMGVFEDIMLLRDTLDAREKLLQEA